MKTENKKVLLALSGGVDSSVAAYLLKKQGHEVIAVFMKNFSDTKNLRGECTWKDEKRSAQQIAAKLNIPLITLDFEKEYKNQVINPMFKSYAKGKTPNPDIACNKIIKFPLLRKTAKKLDISLIATGHYARIKKTKKGFQLLKGKDKEKDQSYFLAGLSQEDLKHTLFPIGSYTKAEIRKIAKKLNFHNWNKQSSRGICFIGKTDMCSFLKQKIKEKPGRIFSPDKTFLGYHKGIMFYTIGQRISLSKPKKDAQKRFYVAKKEPNNILIAAPENHPLLRKKEVRLKHMHLINPEEEIPKKNLVARIRYRGKLHEGRLVNLKFIFKKPVEAAASGQFLVIYKNQKVLASGEIL